MISPASSGPITAFASRAPAKETAGLVVLAGGAVTVVVVEPEFGVALEVTLGVSVTVTTPPGLVEDGLTTVVLP